MSNTIAVIKDKLYPLKVWLSTIGCGSLIFCLYDFLNGNVRDFGDFFGIVLKLLSINIALSLPGLLIYFIAFSGLNTSKLSLILKKLILILLAFSLVLFTWYVINSLFERDVFFSSKSIFIYIDFFACIVVSSFFFGRSTTHNTALVK
jgi:hypothetical protein